MKYREYITMITAFILLLFISYGKYLLLILITLSIIYGLIIAG